MSIVDRYRGAGQSGMRRYKMLARDWQRRTLGRWTSLSFWTAYVILLLAALDYTPESWRFLEGLVFGMLAIAFVLFPQAVMPDHIARWQRGAWGRSNATLTLRWGSRLLSIPL